MGSADWWRCGENHETGIPASESHRTILRQRCPSPRSFALGHAVTDCVPVSQINQAAGKDDDGAKTETVGTGATAEVNAPGSDRGPKSDSRCWANQRSTSSYSKKEQWHESIAKKIKKESQMRSYRPHIMIADDHTFVADACKKLLEPEFEVVAIVGDGRALVRMAASLKPQVI